jgi:hypothetical protein
MAAFFFIFSSTKARDQTPASFFEKVEKLFLVIIWYKALQTKGNSITMQGLYESINKKLLVRFGSRAKKSHPQGHKKREDPFYRIFPDYSNQPFVNDWA